MSGGAASPFLDLPEDAWVAHNDWAFAVRDRYPVNPGHTLVVPHEVIATWWDASPATKAGIMALVDEVKVALDQTHRPEGYNVGFNAGRIAGQTIDHLHLHVIPRYVGDVADPTGGIRHVIPGKGNYLVTTSGNDPSSPELFDSSQEDGRLRRQLEHCLADPYFDRIDLVVSFVMRSGVELLLGHLNDALDRGATIRVLASDYLGITDPQGLSHLVDLQDTERPHGGNLQARLWSGGSTSFHPKAYLFWSSITSTARGFVGSSNLSASGIDGGIEWNLATESVDQLRIGFARLWSDTRAHHLDQDSLAEYRRRRPTPQRRTEPIPIGVEAEAPVQPASPTVIQAEALAALEMSRIDGHRAGLVVMATGLGKTWLAAFDSTRPSVRRVLFVAHREEILTQSRDVFRRVRPDASLGLFYGKEKRSEADVVFASIQTLSRQLAQFTPDEFDYIVIDEFHHADGATYRRVLDYFEPEFLLGLTATPERLDGADLLALCGDNPIFECSLVEGIERDALVPFHYVGLKDCTDFEPIPWRSGRFDPEQLAIAVETQERVNQAIDAWQQFGSGPTLGFCASISHAEFMATQFQARGINAVAVHSQAGSAPRAASLAELREGALSVIFTVDVFNEGVDIPEVATVMMLRPTQSPVVFLQQLGRGLRLAKGKQHLQVIDFIGNHRSFLGRPRILLGLSNAALISDQQLTEAIRTGQFGLPAGCSVKYDLETIDLLKSMTRRSSRNDLAEWCREYEVEHGRRPTAVQAFSSFMNPSSARSVGSTGWFGLLDELGQLDARESEVARRHSAWLVGLEKTNVTKAYKLVALRAMIGEGTLVSGSNVADVAARSLRLVQADPRLVAETTSKEIPDPLRVTADTWADFWRRWPIEHLTTGNHPLFRLEDDRLVMTDPVAKADADHLLNLVEEIVDWRLARHLAMVEARRDAGIICTIGHSSGNPFIRFDRRLHPELPTGWTVVLADGTEYEMNFVKIAVNVARREGIDGNALHNLLRSWFGERAGLPGTRHEVRFEQVEGSWRISPLSVGS